MLIAIDIGNSLIHIGFFTDSGIFVQTMDTHPLLSPAEYSVVINQFIQEKNLDKTALEIIISSVVPDHTLPLKEALGSMSSDEPLIVSCQLKTGLTFAIPNPDHLGSDRIANAVAAFESYKCAVAAVDCGTATAISVVDGQARFLGGAIMPGIRLMSESLAASTSRLYTVPVQPPVSALGIDTTGCIQSGLFYGTAGAVERLLSEIEIETGYRLKVVITGGYGGVISRFLSMDKVFLPNLTLEGLRILYRRNRNA